MPFAPELLWANDGTDFAALSWTSSNTQPEGVVWSVQLTGPAGPSSATTSVKDLTPSEFGVFGVFEHNFTSLAPGKYSAQVAATVKNGDVYGASSKLDIPTLVVGVPGKSSFVGTPAQVAGKLQLKWGPAAADPDPASTV